MNAILKQGSIDISHPKIASEWDFEKNFPLAPSSVGSHSSKIVWWKCQQGHSYQVSVYSRLRSGGCKICNQSIHTEKRRQTKLLKSRSFKDTNPELSNEWDLKKNLLSPEQVSEKSKMKIWWICRNGHEWLSTPQNRSKGYGCPICSRETQGVRIRSAKLKKAGRSLADTHPEILIEWDHNKNSYTPQELLPKSNVKAHWKCKFGHEWTATINNRTIHLSGCPLCSNQSSRLEIFILCELRFIFKEVEWRKKIEGVEFDIFIPEISLAIEVDGEYWHKSKIDRDQMKTRLLTTLNISFIRVRSSQLPTIPGETILFSIKDDPIEICFRLFSLIFKRFPNPLIELYLKEKKQKNSREYQEILTYLPAPPKGKSLSELYPQMNTEWDFEMNFPLTPKLFSPGSNQKAHWICPSGHRWMATINNRTKRKSGCPDCYAAGKSASSRRIFVKKLGSLKNSNPSFLSLWNYEKNKDLHPSEISIRSNVRVNWKCLKGHEYYRSPSQMWKSSSCPKCCSFAELYPQLALEWATNLNNDCFPDIVTPKSSKKIWWKCQKGHLWKTAISERTRGSGCPQCYNEQRSKLFQIAAVRKKGSLLNFNPEFLHEWDYFLNKTLLPDQVTLKSNKKVWWKCKFGHSYLQAICYKANGSGCPTCARTIRAETTRMIKLKKHGSLKDNYPCLASEWHPEKNGQLLASDVTNNSHKKVWWKCRFGHEWLQSPNYRVTLKKRRSNFNCPLCRYH